MTETAELIPVEPAMKTTVYASKGGDRYHRTEDCRALSNGRYLNEALAENYVPGCRYVVPHYVLPRSLDSVIAEGREACRACYPRGGFPTSCEDDFGHEPFPWPGLPEESSGYACARCWYGSSYAKGGPVPWPCTSAIVLGLVPRTDEQDAALRKVVHGCETPETHNAGCPCETTAGKQPS